MTTRLWTIKPGKLHRASIARFLAISGLFGLCLAAALPARAAERSLLGVHIFTPVNTILHRFGDPTYISTGMNIAVIEYLPGMVSLLPPAGSVFGGGNAPGRPGAGGYSAGGPGRPPMGGMGPMGPMGVGGPMGARGPMGPMGMGGPMGPPGMMGRGPALGDERDRGVMSGGDNSMMPGGRPGFGGPGAMGGMGGQGGYGQGADPAETLISAEVTHYYYVRPHGIYYEFVLSSDGRVLSIGVYGIHGDVRTARGTTLGSTYAQVVETYGYPEETVDTSGGALTVSYMKNQHIAFRMDDNRVAGIIVSAAD